MIRFARFMIRLMGIGSSIAFITIAVLFTDRSSVAQLIFCCISALAVIVAAGYAINRLTIEDED